MAASPAVSSGGRLYAILARESQRAVVFRRGPSKWVLLVSWDRARDAFSPGQWFHGRIYERRCDLSPSGERLVYFAASWKGPLQTWTAVCKPPWITAIALWPKGDAWGGGGLWEGERLLRLNHPASQMALAPGFSLPRRVRVESLGPWSGRGEDGPIQGMRLARDGWRAVQEGRSRWRGLGAKSSFDMEPPAIDERPAPGGGLTLRKTTVAIGERGGPWWVEEFALVERRARAEAPLGRLDWADWDCTGDLLFARSGRVYRWRPDLDARGRARIDDAREIADLRALRPESIEAPPRAREWY